MSAAAAATALRLRPRTQDGSDERAPPDPTQLTLQDLEPHFCTKTIHEAARAMGVGLTALKRRCRALGIKRWPFRMVRKQSRHVSRHPLRMSSNADAPRAQLSSIAKMMDQVKKEGENKELEKNEREDKQVRQRQAKSCCLRHSIGASFDPRVWPQQYTLELLQEYYDNLRQHPDEPVEKDVLQDVMRIRQAFFKVRAELAAARVKAEPPCSPQQTHNLKKGGQQSTKARRPVQPQELPFSFENW